MLEFSNLEDLKMKVTADEIITIIEDALGIQKGLLTIDSDNTSVTEWDSLGHFAVLSALDHAFKDITEHKPELAEAVSIQKIFEVINY